MKKDIKTIELIKINYVEKKTSVAESAEIKISSELIKELVRTLAIFSVADTQISDYRKTLLANLYITLSSMNDYAVLSHLCGIPMVFQNRSEAFKNVTANKEEEGFSFTLTIEHSQIVDTYLTLMQYVTIISSASSSFEQHNYSLEYVEQLIDILRVYFLPKENLN